MKAASASPSWARSASCPTATWPASGSGACAGPASRSPTARASRPARASASAWPCPPATRAWASTSTSTSARRRRSTRPSCPALVTPSLPDGHGGPGRRSPIAAGHRLAAAGGHQLQLADRGRSAVDRRRDRRRRRRASLAADDAAHRGRAQGQRRHLDARPAILGPVALAADGGARPAELATQPRSLRPAELLRALDPTLGRGPGAANPPMDAGRRRPLRADPPRGPRRRAARRRPRTRERVRHEKGSPP